MRRRAVSLLCALVVGLSLGGALSSTGCASGATPMRKAYTTISDATAAATAVMQAFNERYQAGNQTEADRTLALQAWSAFQATAHVAELIAKDPNRTADPLAVISDAVAKLTTTVAAIVPKKSEMSVPFWMRLFEPPLRVAYGGVL